MRGVTLEEMSETTKISVRLLRALEQDRFGELPGGVFTRSFIRAYAQYLGLEEEHVLSEYKRVAQPSSDNDLSRLPARTIGDSTSRGRVLPWVVVAVLLGSGYAVYRYSRRTLEVPSSGQTSVTSSSGSGATPSSSAPPSGSVPGRAAAQPGGSSSVQANGQAPAPATANQTPVAGNPVGTAESKAADASQPDKSDATQPVAPNAGAQPADGANSGAPVLGEGDMVLEVKTSEEAWIAIAADGKVLMQHQLPPNSVRAFRAKDAFDVTTGNAQGTVLTFNGVAQKPLGREGEFKRIHLARTAPQSSATQKP